MDQFTKQNLIDERLLFHKNLLQNHGYMGPKQAMFFVKIGKFGVLYFGGVWNLEQILLKLHINYH